MIIDEKIPEAIQKATKKAGQPEQLAPKIIAWFYALANEGQTGEDRDSEQMHLDLLFESVQISKEADD